MSLLVNLRSELAAKGVTANIVGGTKQLDELIVCTAATPSRSSDTNRARRRASWRMSAVRRARAGSSCAM